MKSGTSSCQYGVGSTSIRQSRIVGTAMASAFVHNRYLWSTSPDTEAENSRKHLWRIRWRIRWHDATGSHILGILRRCHQIHVSAPTYMRHPVGVPAGTLNLQVCGVPDLCFDWEGMSHIHQSGSPIEVQASRAERCTLGRRPFRIGLLKKATSHG